MKTNLSRVALAMAALASLSAQPALAESDNENAAIVVQGESCTSAVPTEDGRIIGANMFVDPDGRSQRVETSSGNAFLMCHFTVPAKLKPSSKRTAEGFGCRVGKDGVRTTETQILVTPSGRGMMTCRLP
ncbi:hypothetical protein [Croceicoccus sp. BE223]|uniref:hypothetical protein n=1 Tax=Croceicoccus sp. BE223 TaxID=2817716 RepID=UPI00285FD92B|nr:hypothetical protein [Croceicoccus sp. BE223]MDR7102704.1 hypothetical protein [Croceicoccus sp. BE223]